MHKISIFWMNYNQFNKFKPDPTEIKFGGYEWDENFIGHQLWQNEFITNVIEGKRGRGKSNKSYLGDIKLQENLKFKIWEA